MSLNINLLHTNKGVIVNQHNQNEIGPIIFIIDIPAPQHTHTNQICRNPLNNLEGETCELVYD
jgi:hypothetical protein